MSNNELPIMWSTQIYAPLHYGVYLVSGECHWYYEENKRVGLGFSGEAGAGWRTGGAAVSGGTPDSPVILPMGVQLIWLSTTEKKYYYIQIKLPRERILEEFAKEFGFEYRKKSDPAQFNSINFSCAPGGFVQLRLGGTRAIEIANFQAREIEMSWDFFALTNHFVPDSYPEAKFMQDYYDKLPDDIKLLVDNDDIPVEQWKNYSTKFNWHLTTSMKLLGCRISSVNCNNVFYDTNHIESHEYIEQEYAPAWISLYYYKNHSLHKANIIFSKQNFGRREEPDSDVLTFNTFKEFFSSHQLKTTLVLEEKDSSFIAFLTNGSKRTDININHIQETKLEDSEILELEWFK